MTHLLRTSWRYDAVWVIVDRVTKSTHFLVVQMTFTLDEFYKIYIQEIVQLHGVLYSVLQRRLGDLWTYNSKLQSI